MASELLSRCIIIVFGLLYPAYGSYKAIKSRSTSMYVQWMMYWIVFALFYNVETIADLLISWFPMYYEMKAIFVIWLLSPATQGSQILYKLYIHPHLLKHEQEIEQTLERVKSQSYSTLLNAGAQGMNMALQGAIVGQTKLADHLKKSYSFDSTDSAHSLRRQISEEDVSDDQIYPLRHRYRPTQQVTPQFTDAAQRDYISPQENTYSQNYRSAVEKVESAPSYQNTPRNISFLRNSQSGPGLSLSNKRPIKQSEKSTKGARIVSPVSKRPSFIAEKSRDHETPHQRTYTRRTATTQEKSSQNQRPTALAPENSVSSPSKGPSSSKPVLSDADHKRRFSESTLRYRTKKISDIKSHKIESPFVSIF